MKVRTLWECDPNAPDVCPWLVDAVDEYTEDEWGGTPDDYRKNMEAPNRRELVLDVPESAVRGLFWPATVKVTVVR